MSLSDYAGRYVVLFFYPLDFTFVCPTEIIAFNDRLVDLALATMVVWVVLKSIITSMVTAKLTTYRAAEFEALGCSVIACSTDSHFSHLAWSVLLVVMELKLFYPGARSPGRRGAWGR